MSNNQSRGSIKTFYYKIVALESELRNFKKTAILRKLFATLLWLAEIYKKKLPGIFQATNEAILLSWSHTKRQKPFFCIDTFILKFEQMYLPEMRVDNDMT